MTNTIGRRRGRWIPAAWLVAAIVLVTIAAIGLIHATAKNDTGPVDMRGHHVQADVTPTGQPSATESGAGRFVVPSVGLDVPLGALNVVDDTIEPPGFTSAYWVRNLGVSPTNASKGTVFVALHSLRNGGVGPGNYLIDVAHQKAKVSDGATIRVAGVRYRITHTEAIEKADIGDDKAVWVDTPNRLIVITCLQRQQGGPSIDNMLIEATRV